MNDKRSFRPLAAAPRPHYPLSAPGSDPTTTAPRRPRLAGSLRTVLLLGVGFLGAYGGCMPLPPAAIDPQTQQRRAPVAPRPDAGGTVLDPAPASGPATHPGPRERVEGE